MLFDSIDNKASPEMTDEVKKIIEDCIDQKMKPLLIIDKLWVIKLPVPTPHQISNYVAKNNAFKY